MSYQQVFLVVEPKFEWDAGAVKRRERAAKSAKIAAAELFRMSPLLDDTSAGPTEGQSAPEYQVRTYTNNNRSIFLIWE